MKPQSIQDSFSPLLGPMSGVYSLAMRVRRKLYSMRFLPRYEPLHPTISVGNISWGGTGKTPVTDWITGWALQKELKPVILTRGYRGKLPYVPLHVNPAHKASEVGDEPLMLSQSHPLAAVMVDPVRTRAATYASSTFRPDLFILDDGFQHIGMGRHLDLVLLTYSDLGTGWNRIIPAGTWREPNSALKYADAYLIKTVRSEWEEVCSLFDSKLSNNPRPLFGFTLQPIGIIPVTGEYYAFPASVLGNSPYAFVTGIGQPEQAKNSVTMFMGRPPDVTKVYPDHYEYSIKDAIALTELKMPIICTHKDAVKLKSYYIENLWYLKVRTYFGASHGTSLDFERWIDLWWSKQDSQKPSNNKEGLGWLDTDEFNGNSANWGENMSVSETYDAYRVPPGWGPIQDEEEIKAEEPQYLAELLPTKETTAQKEKREKDKRAYFLLEEENKKKVEEQENLSGKK